MKLLCAIIIKWWSFVWKNFKFISLIYRCCDSADDQRKAWISLAETAKDCGLWERCVYFYEQARKWEKELGYDDEKVSLKKFFYFLI